MVLSSWQILGSSPKELRVIRGVLDKAHGGESRVNYNDQTSVSQALASIRPSEIINLAEVADVAVLDSCDL